MKKTILIEPKLLAKIKQNSPAVYEYLCNSPFMKIEFADYSIGGQKMFIQKNILDMLEPLKKFKESNIPGIIGALQIGYAFGIKDWMSRVPVCNNSMLKLTHEIGTLLNLALNYPYYTVESLLNPVNFDYRMGAAYNKITYKEAQYFMSWELLLKSHEVFNGLFVDINKKRAMEGLDNMGIINYTSALN